MMTGARRMQAGRLADGRLHLNDGPIDLVIACDGDTREIARAEEAAIARFAYVLDELCAELHELREPAGPVLTGPVAQRMARAVMPFARDHFITPMAAVAGSVADEILAVMTGEARLQRAVVNNGGDIAFHLAPGARLSAGHIDRPDRPSLFATSVIEAKDPVRGLATSGWRGRSFSLGIADAVSVLAEDAARADASATIIANAVDLSHHPAIRRRPASDLQPDSDLGARLVTVAVGPLSDGEIADALSYGARTASHLMARGLIAGAALHLAGRTMTIGTLASLGESAATDRKELAHA